MENRSIFLYFAQLRRGDGEGQAGRVLDIPVQACRESRQENPVRQSRDAMPSPSSGAKPLMPCFQEKPLSFRLRGTVP